MRISQLQPAATSEVPVSGRSGLSCPIVRFRNGQLRNVNDTLAVEEPLEMRLCHGPIGSRQTRSLSVTMRTPGNDRELAVGFLVTEGVIRDSADIVAIDWIACQPQGRSATALSISPFGDGRTFRYNTLRVELDPRVVVNSATLERNFYTTSSCGICGKASLLALRTICPRRSPDSFKIESSLLWELPAKARSSQSLFEITGGLHASALFDSRGRLHSLQEDVGRHNAVDKLIGGEFLANRVPLQDRLLFLSGRASFELLQKALMTGIPMVVSIGAPSSLAVQLAREFDITLVGFLRDRQFNIYSRPERVCFSEQERKRHETED